MRSVTNRLLPVVALFLAAAPALADLPAARLTAVFPPGGQAGSTVDVTVTGVDLDGAAELRFSRPGITAKKADGASDTQTEARFTVTVDKDVPVGTCDARVVGRFGVTNARLFAVGDRPELTAPSDHHAPDKAMTLPPDTVVNGRCSAAAVDCYAVELKKGQRVLFDCQTREVDARTSPMLVLTDGDGHELDRSRRGGLLDFTPDADGKYVLAVGDLLYRGGPEYYYRLTAGTGPHLDAIFPPAGEPGSKGKYTLYGRNLPGGSHSDLRAADGKPLEELTVDIELPGGDAARRAPDADALLGPPGAGLDGIEYRLKSDKGSSNPVLITFARAPVVVEKEPNDKPAAAQKVSVPCEVVGRFYPRDDSDWFEFDAAKGDSYWVEVVSDRLGLPTAPSVLLQHVKRGDKGDDQATDVQELAGTDTNTGGQAFRTANRDAGYRLVVKEAGTYRVMVRDLFAGPHDDASRVYRLSIRPAKPDFRLAALPVAPVLSGGNQAAEAVPTTAFLRRGGALPVRVVLYREDGFDGDVEVRVEGLPKGVSCPPATLRGKEDAATLIVSAADDVATWDGTVRVVGKAKVGDEDVEREARPAAVVWGPAANGQVTEPVQARLTHDLALSVSGDEIEPLSLRVTGGPFEIQSGETLKLPVKVTRRGDVKGALKIRAVGLPGQGGGGGKELTMEGKTDEGTLEVDLSKQRFPPGTYTFAIQTQAQVKYDGDRPVEKPGDKPPEKGKKGQGGGGRDSQVVFYSPAVVLTVTAPPEKDKKK
jgi:hypothetical protein